MACIHLPARRSRKSTAFAQDLAQWARNAAVCAQAAAASLLSRGFAVRVQESDPFRRLGVSKPDIKQSYPEHPSLAAVSIAFLKVSLYGIGGGGGLVWARRITVDQQRWISEQDFADIVSLVQFIPGPRPVGIR